MSDISGVFDETKDYESLQLQNGQFVAAKDFNHLQDIADYDSTGKAVYPFGYFLKINALTNSPLRKIRASSDIGEGCVLTFEMVDATHVKWKTNGGGWSASIAVTADGVTWNTVGTSGLDVIFADTAIAADSSEVWVARGMRLLGGEFHYQAGVTFTLDGGKWLLEGKFKELASDSVNCNDGDYVYVKITKTNVDQSTDTDLGHFMYDGNYSAKSPIASQRVYDLLASAVFPTAVSSPYTKYIIVGKIINAAGGTFIQAWDTPIDLQQIARLYADTTPPATPTGLALSSDAEDGLITAVVGTIKQTETVLGYLKMSCDVNPEADISDYEFKVCRLDGGHNPTADVQTILVKLNLDAGGFGIPLGVSHTIHNLTVGVEYRVWVRAIDFAGNASDWSASVDQFVGDVCDIAVGAAAPTIALADTEGFVGVTLTVTVMPANSAGFTVWVGEGAYPAIASNESLVGHYPAGQGIVNIPWKESGSPHVRVVAFDDAGLYHVDALGALVVAEASINLLSSAQLQTETHNNSASSHGSTIADVLICQEKHGSLYKWLVLLSNQGFDLENVYIVGESGANYASVQAALNAIESDLPSIATILVAPGTFDGAAPIVFPDLVNPATGNLATQVVIQGIGRTRCAISSDIDVSLLSASPNPVSAPSYPGIAGLTLRDVTVTGRIYGTKVALPVGMLVLDSVTVFSSEGINPLVKLDAAVGGGFYSYIYNSYLINFGAQPVIEYLGSNNFNIEGTTINQYSLGAVDAISLTGIAGSIRYIKNSTVQVFNAAAGVVIDSSVGATTVVMSGNTFNTAVGANIAPTVGTIDTNTVIAGNIIAV